MTIGARVELGVRAGFPTTTTCKLVVASLADGDVVITGSWGTSTITAANMVAIGSPVVGYVGSIEITGLSSLTRYTYSAVQGSKTASGSFMTAPGDRDDFSLFFAGCDCNTIYNNPDNVAYPGHVTGIWDVVRDYAQNGDLPTVGVFFVDDIGYVDYYRGDDTANTGLAVTNLTSGPASAASIKDYAIAYMSNLGMLGHATTAPTNRYVAWGRDEDRAWCSQNLNVFPQWGDHEFVNDIGILYPTASATPISVDGFSVTPAAIFAAGKAAWDAFMGPLQPAVFNAADSNGWGAALGCVNLVAPDRITNANGTWVAGSDTGVPTTFFGTNQITSILSYLESSTKPFNLFGMSNSLRNMTNTKTTSSSGGQHPMDEICNTEYLRMFRTTGLSPKSIMDNASANGLNGVSVLLHSDYHHACVKHHAATLNGSALAENFWSVYVGTVSGSTNFTMPVAEGVSYNGTTLEWDSGWTSPNNDYAGMRVDVYGSRSRPELHVTLIDANGGTMWSGKWLARSSNEALNITYEVPQLLGTSSKATSNSGAS